ncbi:arylsulfatase [Mycobacterium sp. CVI_P3]|uniref:Arylsulfatase n=1 Tax=Mycobacterium pinniadriaticum TaxID=2994102 RepID=A0ABT3SKM3_9MYCO|nr:arylsulfatase [Mycobacterium pinniadriaticum]MCX2933642.1 arylsulfatase [Mycobacterium pinniadriaticum]MCX2940071.1 arylsulfatase [Mycobacterium pinniadriaticum]
MAEDPAIVVVAAYQDLGVATTDFDALTAQVVEKKFAMRGAVLVAKDAEGNATLVDTGNQMGRRGAGWGAGVGLAVGLFAPPLLAAVAVGAAAGAVAGTFADHRVKSGLQDKIGQALAEGTGVIIAVIPAASRLALERVLTGSLLKSVAELDSKTMRGLESALEEAMGKFSPDRTRLPIPDKAFGGVAGRTLRESVSDWSIAAGVKAPEGAPNVLIVLIDDAGFGGPDTFGGDISTPTMSRLAENGLTYNRFHVTAVCSPTRAALLTGRNHHRCGFGSIAEYPGPYPGYSATLPRTIAPLPRVLRDNGYVTGGFGKWHLTPDNVQGAAGPFDRWPNGWGFDHWWGFLSGAAGQYDPIITQDNGVIGVPSEGKDGRAYYFPDDLTDKAVEWLHAVRAQDATKPWMMYYSTGATHAPHHVFSEWADKYKGRFDDGWDAYRERTLERQKQLGIVPPDTELTPRPDLFPAWDSLTDDQRKLYVRQMEVFAGFSENADWNVGRLVDAIDDLGDLDNTLIFYIWGDNGASMEGTITGSFNEMTFLNGVVLDAEHQLKLIEQYGGIEALGGEHTAPHFASAWAHANNTPFQWGKQMASHLGGTRDPMIVHWPARITADKAPRTQFTHCIDIAPTVLDVVGLPMPVSVDGFDQEPMDGTSFGTSLTDGGAAETRTVQYFEMFGSRAIYADGWWACTRLDKAPWDFSPETIRRFGPDGDYDPDNDVWELYYLPDDFSQAHDLADTQPEKLVELKELWWSEAERNRVLPLLGGMSVLLGDLPPMPTITRFAFRGDVQNIQRGMVPRILGRSYSIEAQVTIPDGGAEGVLVANADFIGGFALWVDEQSLLHHTYSMLGVDTYHQVSSTPIPTGDVTVKMLFEITDPTPGSGGHVTLWADGELIGEGDMPNTVPIAFSSYAGMDIGRDNGLVVDRAYEDKAPYAFTGTVKQVVFDLQPIDHEAEKALHEHAAMQAVGQGAAG